MDEFHYFYFIEIVRRAQNLKNFHLHNVNGSIEWNFLLDDVTILEIVEIFRSQNRNKPLELFLNQDEQFEITEDDEQFVQLKHCQGHKRFG